MTDYSNGRNVLLKRPEPGRPAHVIEKKEIVTSAPIDTNAIADAVIKAIVSKMPAGGMVATERKTVDEFDSSESLQRLANAMTIPEQQGNVEGMGTVKEVKKDQKEVDKTRDLLSQLGD